MTENIVVATRNMGKVAELARMLSSLEVHWLTLSDLKVNAEVAETGSTFAENAILKAEGYASLTGKLTLADDSGLEVDALQSRPGVHTARFGGQGLSPEQRYLYLLESLAGVPWKARSARFRCAVALADSHGLIGLAAGVCHGVIALEPSGLHGFGYDPVFYLPDQARTMAELTSEEKERISHRGRAMSALTPLLRRVLAERLASPARQLSD